MKKIQYWIFLGMLLLSFLRNEGCLKSDARGGVKETNEFLDSKFGNLIEKSFQI